jgi:hypothetical protein
VSTALIAMALSGMRSNRLSYSPADYLVTASSRVPDLSPRRRTALAELNAPCGSSLLHEASVYEPPTGPRETQLQYVAGAAEDHAKVAADVRSVAVRAGAPELGVLVAGAVVHANHVALGVELRELEGLVEDPCSWP